jgi:hypothetical protein
MTMMTMYQCKSNPEIQLTWTMETSCTQQVCLIICAKLSTQQKKIQNSSTTCTLQLWGNESLLSQKTIKVKQKVF